MLQCRFTNFAIARLVKSEKGVLLVAALTLLSALTLVGTTAYLLSSTDIKIGGNFRNNQMALQVAMAGTERAPPREGEWAEGQSEFPGAGRRPATQLDAVLDVGREDLNSGRTGISGRIR